MQQVTNERAVFASLYRVYSVSTDNIFMWSIQYKGDGSREATFACSSWEMDLNDSVDGSLDNV
jgi:hypothetical protein